MLIFLLSLSDNFKSIYMKKTFFLMLLTLMSMNIHATIWYASPSGTGSGTITSPFNLQTALTNSPVIILPGDTLYLRAGTYIGATTRFNSNLTGTSCAPITVMSYPGEWAILNGSLVTPNATITATLRVNGAYAIYRDFEVRYNSTNYVLRNDSNPSYIYCGGIEHFDGINCKFINLVIHDNPGTGFWSNKSTGGTEIYGCLIYNNGWLTNTTSLNRGRGPGIYAQNETEDMRIFKNNIVFNNFYNGFEVWSASTDQPEIVKNFEIDNNTSFNNGSPYSNDGGINDLGSNNVLVATMDNQTNGNYPRNISITNNELYHNTLFTDATLNGEARPLKIGHVDSETHDIIVDNNFLCGRNPGLELNTSYNLTFTNNTVLSKYVYVAKKNFDLGLINNTNFNFDNNKYYTRRSSPGRDFRLTGMPDYFLSDWQTAFSIDLSSTRYPWNLNLNTAANNPTVTKVTRNEYNQNVYKVVLFKYDTANPNVTVDFSSYGIPSGTAYTIKDVETYPTPTSTGTYTGTPITFNLNLTSTSFNKPLITTLTDFPTCYSTQTPNNFGAFLIEFAPYHSANNIVYTSNIQTDGKIIIGGDFTKYNTTTTNVTRIARLNTDMKHDATFVTGTGANNRVNASLIHTAGKIIIAGRFTTYNSIGRNRIARLNTTGSNDATFVIGTGIGTAANDEILALAQQTDGKILIGGLFSTYNGTARINIARLTSTGGNDATFSSSFVLASGIVNTIAIQADGKILVGGTFSNYGVNAASKIVRLNTNGTIDTTFSIGTGFDGEVTSIIMQPDGKILVGGSFQNYNGVAIQYICRLLSTGLNDATFVPDLVTQTGNGSAVKTIRLQSDGKILIGGGFSTVGSNSRLCIARLTTTGTTDTTFDPGAGFGPFNARPRCPSGYTGTYVKTISIQTDGKFVCGGQFDSYNNNPVKNITRLNPLVTGAIGRQASDINLIKETSNLVPDLIAYNEKIIVYPNPLKSNFSIHTSDVAIDFIEIYNSKGVLIKTQYLGDSENKIQMDEFTNDTYYYKIYNKKELLKSGILIKE